MAFNPYTTPKYNIADPYGTSPSQRLAKALAGSAMQGKGARRQYGGQSLIWLRVIRNRFRRLKQGSLGGGYRILV